MRLVGGDRKLESWRSPINPIYVWTKLPIFNDKLDELRFNLSSESIVHSVSLFHHNGLYQVYIREMDESNELNSGIYIHSLVAFIM